MPTTPAPAVTIDDILDPARAAAQRRAALDREIAQLDQLITAVQAARRGNLAREIARTDTVMLRSLKAGFERMGTPECLESAGIIGDEIRRRSDATCEAWARKLRMNLAVQS